MNRVFSYKSKTDICLVFPPVWLPIAPHLALPTLTSYLRDNGFTVKPMDANISFFERHLFSPPVILESIEKARDLLHRPKGKTGGREEIPGRKELGRWERAAHRMGHFLSVLREKERFMDPVAAVESINNIRSLFDLYGKVGYGDLSFNHYRRDDIHTLKDLMEISGDPERNVFLPYFRDHLLPRIERRMPLALGISISSIHQFVAALTLARLVRSRLPHVHVVAGGKHLLNIQHGLLKEPFLFRNFFHSAVLFEGEVPLGELLRALRAGSSYEQVPNLYFMKAGAVRHTSKQDPPSLDSLPRPDFSDTPWEQYLVPGRYAPVRAAEGCYWGKCTFCFRYGPDRAVFLSPGKVLDAMEHLIEVHGVHDFTVNDDCLPPEYWEEIAEGIIMRNLRLSMLIWAKPVAGFTRARLKRMARAGVRQVRWGVESGQPRILRLMRKGTTVEHTLRVLKDAHAEGIWNHACMIIGFPTETPEEAEGTVRFLQQNSGIIQSFILYPFALYENTYIYNHPHEFGISDIQREEKPLAERYSYTQEKGMTPEEARVFVPRAKQFLMDSAFHRPFWYHLKIREYLQIYLDHYGLERVRILSPFPEAGPRDAAVAGQGV